MTKIKKCPCEECICLAVCISMEHVDCSILWNHYKDPNYMFQDVSDVLPKLLSLTNETRGTFDHEIGTII